jgi:hypothetical protein
VSKPTRWRAFRRAPLWVQLLLVVTVALLCASLVCVAAELASPGNAVVGTFGVSSLVLGAAVAADLGGSGQALGELGRALRPGGARSGGPQRGIRALAVYYVIFGLVLAVAGYGGFIHWRR